jgi:hypothetical protein
MKLAGETAIVTSGGAVTLVDAVAIKLPLRGLNIAVNFFSNSKGRTKLAPEYQAAGV